MMAGRTLLILLVSTCLCSVLGDPDDPCTSTTCDQNANCYQERVRQEHDENGNVIAGNGDAKTAICIDKHGFVETIKAYDKSCPKIREIGIGGDRASCESDNFVNKCALDAECDQLTHMCCYDGCRTTCQRFILSSKNHLQSPP